MFALACIEFAGALVLPVLGRARLWRHATLLGVMCGFAGLHTLVDTVFLERGFLPQWVVWAGCFNFLLSGLQLPALTYYLAHREGKEPTRLERGAIAIGLVLSFVGAIPGAFVADTIREVHGRWLDVTYTVPETTPWAWLMVYFAVANLIPARRLWRDTWWQRGIVLLYLVVITGYLATVRATGFARPGVDAVVFIFLFSETIVQLGRFVKYASGVEDTAADLGVQWEAMVMQSPLSVTIWDREGRLQFSNRSVAATGYPSSVGKHVSELVSLGSPIEPVMGPIRNVIDTGEMVTIDHFVASRHHGKRWYEASLGPITRNGERNVIMFSRDITHRWRFTAMVEQTVRATAEFRGEALLNAIAALFAEVCSPAVVAVAMIRGAELKVVHEVRNDPDRELKGHGLHPLLSRKLLNDEYAGATRAEIEANRVSSVPTIFQSIMSVPLRNAQNVPIGVFVVASKEPVEDGPLALQTLRLCANLAAAELQRSEAFAELENANQHLEERVATANRALSSRLQRVLGVLDGIPAMVAYWDTEERCRFANSMYMEWFGIPASAMINRSMEEVLGQAYMLNKPYIQAAMSGQPQVFERALRDVEGRARHTQAYYLPDLVDGRVEGMIAFVVDVTTQKNAELEARSASRVRDEFLANMSHELRTPLNAILGMTEAVLENVYGPLTDKQRSSLQIVSKSGSHLLDLISDILDLSRIEAGALSLSLSNVRVAPLCGECIAYVSDAAQKKNIGISLKCDPAFDSLSADSRRLKQILLNLLANAVKFTGTDGTIKLEVTGSAAANEIYFSVTDTGIGIAPDRLDDVFRPFVMLDAGLSRSREGTGLGLALVRQLVALHGGRITVESTVGVGSHFKAILPWYPELTHVSVPAQLRSSKAVEKPLGSLDILLVEDNEANIATMQNYLEMKSCSVEVARNGTDGVRLANARRYDVILMDIQLPDLDGFECMRRIKTGTFHDVPIIAVTGLTMPGDREKCLAAGASDYMAKPVHLAELARMIRSLAKPR